MSSGKLQNIVVEVERLTKRYGGTVAVDNVSFRLEEGKIYGLLGRNGAGKTTVMHLITAQWFATGGSVRVFGQQPYENSEVLSKVCFIKESQKYPDHFRIQDVLDISSAIFPNWDREYASLLMADFGLPAKRRMKKLSRGMLSSVGIIIGLASRAPLTIFDEPYVGLDVVARGLFYDRLLQDYAEHPRTIILSTHLIDEVSRLLEHVLLIDKGRLVINEQAESLRGRAFTVSGPSAQIDVYARDKRVIHRQSLGGFASVSVWEDADSAARGQAEQLGLELAPVSLQQLIVYLTGNEMKEAAPR